MVSVEVHFASVYYSELKTQKSFQAYLSLTLIRVKLVAYLFVVLDISAGQGNCNGAGARNHTEDRWCYVAENVNGRKVEAQTACPDAVRSSVHTQR